MRLHLQRASFQVQFLPTNAMEAWPSEAGQNHAHTQRWISVPRPNTTCEEHLALKQLHRFLQHTDGNEGL